MTETIQKEILGNKMKLAREDKGLSKDLVEDGIREPHTTYGYRKALETFKNNDNETVILDIGANIGYYALQPCEILNNVRVIAIEPEKTNIELLKQNVKLNGYEDKFDIIHAGAGAEKDTAKMYLFDDYNLHSMNQKKKNIYKEKYYDTINIDILPISNILNSKNINPSSVDIIRMDVEGYDAEVFRGMESVFNSNDNIMCNIEFHFRLMTDDDNNYIRDLFSNSLNKIYSSAQTDKNIPIQNFNEAMNHKWIELVFKWRNDN